MPYKKNHGPNSNYRWEIICSLTTVLLFSSSTVTQAASYFWSVSSGNWSTASNWGGAEPTSSDDAYIQNGGTATITKPDEQCSNLYLGAAKSGTVKMSTGSLTVSGISYIGYSGTGTFTQTGGTNTISSYLYIGYYSGSSGTYNLSGGTLKTSKLYISNSGTGRFEWFYNGLTTQTLTLGSSGTLAMGFNFDMATLTSGTLFNGGTLTGLSSATLEITNNATSTESGNTSVSMKYLTLGTSTGNGTYNLSGTGQLSAYKEYIGNSGTGTFTQTGGTNSISSSLDLGCYSGSSGTYNLSDTGQLSASGEHIGYSGTGTFTQTGGTNSTTYAICLGYYSGSSGTYNLTGGINSISTNVELLLGYNSGSSGTYNLSGTGNLSAGYEFIGWSGTGTFTQTGGTNAISSYLRLGYYSGAKGTYNLSGTGKLSAYSEYISDFGTGTFTQTGGTNSISSYLCLGYYSGSSGTYNLKGGTLILKSLAKRSGTAAFNFGGGTLQASGDFTTTLPMTLTGDGGNANIDTAGYAVTISGVLSGTGGLNKLGSGILTLSATETYNGDTTVGGGTLIFAGGIDSGGTSLIDVESGSVVLMTTNVSKSDLDIYTAVSATFEVVDGMHAVGDISGSGTTQVDSGASLTATSISQGTLTIGSGATVTIQAIPGGPLGNTITAVPEPSTLALLAVAFLIPAYSRVRRWLK
jgi:hypothetical protein